MAGNITKYGASAANNAIQLAVAKKNSAGTITKGQVVYCVGYDATNDMYLVELAKADSGSTMPSVGIAYDTFTNTTDGAIILSGDLPGIDTSSFNVNQEVYVSGSVAGAITATKPITAYVEKLGIVVRSHATDGVLQVYNYGTAEAPSDNRSSGAAEDSTTTNSTSYVEKLMVSMGTVPAGTYQVMWYGEQSSAKISIAVKVRVRIDDTTTVMELTRQMSSANEFFPLTGFVFVTLTAGSHTIDMDYCTNAGSGASTDLRCARLSSVRVG